MSKDVGHYKVVYPPGIERGVKRTSHKASVYLVLGDREIKLPGVTGLTLAASLEDVDRVTLGLVGTIEVLYAEGEAAEADVLDDDMAALIDAVRDANSADA